MAISRSSPTAAALSERPFGTCRDHQTAADFGPIQELFQRIGLGATAGYDLARRDALPVPVIRVGRQLYYSRRAFDDLLNRQHGCTSAELA